MIGIPCLTGFLCEEKGELEVEAEDIYDAGEKDRVAYACIRSRRRIRVR